MTIHSDFRHAPNVQKDESFYTGLLEVSLLEDPSALKSIVQELKKAVLVGDEYIISQCLIKLTHFSADVPLAIDQYICYLEALEEEKLCSYREYLDLKIYDILNNCNCLPQELDACFLLKKNLPKFCSQLLSLFREKENIPLIFLLIKKMNEHSVVCSDCTKRFEIFPLLFELCKAKDTPLIEECLNLLQRSDKHQEESIFRFTETTLWEQIRLHRPYSDYHDLLVNLLEQAYKIKSKFLLKDCLAETNEILACHQIIYDKIELKKELIDWVSTCLIENLKDLDQEIELEYLLNFLCHFAQMPSKDYFYNCLKKLLEPFSQEEQSQLIYQLFLKTSRLSSGKILGYLFSGFTNHMELHDHHSFRFYSIKLLIDSLERSHKQKANFWFNFICQYPSFDEEHAFVNLLRDYLKSKLCLNSEIFYLLNFAMNKVPEDIRTDLSNLCLEYITNHQLENLIPEHLDFSNLLQILPKNTRSFVHYHQNMILDLGRDEVAYLPSVVLKARVPLLLDPLKNSDLQNIPSFYLLDFIARPQKSFLSQRATDWHILGLLFPVAIQLKINLFVDFCEQLVLIEKNIKWEDLPFFLQMFEDSSGNFKLKLQIIILDLLHQEFKKKDLREQKKDFPQGFSHVKFQIQATKEIPVNWLLNYLKDHHFIELYYTEQQVTKEFIQFLKYAIPFLTELNLQNCELEAGALQEIKNLFPYLEGMKLNHSTVLPNSSESLALFHQITDLSISQPTLENLKAIINMPLKFLTLLNWYNADQQLTKLFENKADALKCFENLQYFEVGFLNNREKQSIRRPYLTDEGALLLFSVMPQLMHLNLSGVDLSYQTLQKIKIKMPFLKSFSYQTCIGDQCKISLDHFKDFIWHFVELKQLAVTIHLKGSFQQITDLFQKTQLICLNLNAYFNIDNHFMETLAAIQPSIQEFSLEMGYYYSISLEGLDALKNWQQLKKLTLKIAKLEMEKLGAIIDQLPHLQSLTIYTDSFENEKDKLSHKIKKSIDFKKFSFI